LIPFISAEKGTKNSHISIGWQIIGLILFALGACSVTPHTDPRCAAEAQATSRLFLQQVTADSAIVKWRGKADAVCAGTDPDNLNIFVQASTQAGHQLAQLSGLEADTLYYYAVGGAAPGSPEQSFRTAPQTGGTSRDGNIHILLLGDSGTATESIQGRSKHAGEALEVLQGFQKYNADQGNNEALDLLLLLGDNAYLAGTDEQWQGAFFDIYPELITHTAVWPTIGNHEMGVAPLDICLLFAHPRCAAGPMVIPMGGVSDSSDPNSYDGKGDGPDEAGFPYLNIFSLPAQGEAGGVASGTEQYYAFDYGNVHIVSLDSQLSNRDPVQRDTMRNWLIEDLSANQQDWTVVIFHHPPYSRGENHDSDLEPAEIDMRKAFTPVFEDYGVDVVYSGHAHSYERSWYLNGHQGAATTFNAQEHTQLNAAGEPSLGQGDEAYQQISADTGTDDKAVYTVAGNAGKADDENPCPEGRSLGCTMPNWLTHPAHRTFDAATPGARSNGLARKGSVVLDIGKDTLTSRLVDDRGQVLDYFTIMR
jgi:hypothetical protein